MSELPDHEGQPRQCARHLLHSPRAGGGQLGARPGQLLLRHQGRHQPVPLLRVREVRVPAALQVTSCYVKYIVYCHVHVFREGYTGADGFLTHVNEVKEHLDSIISKVGVDRVKVCMKTFYILHPPACLPRSSAWALQRNWTRSDLRCLGECQVLAHSAQ